MTEAKPIEGTAASGGPTKRSARSVFAGLEIDGRLIGMIAALIILWVLFNVLSNGLFLSPRNLWNLSVQSAAIAIMTCGMVLIIVSRNIDLSIGSILVFVALVMGLLQTEWLPNVVGLGLNHPATWVIVVIIGIALGALIGGVHGVLIAYIGIPSFIVTLGGLLIWRGAAFVLARGRTISPLDTTFQLLGGGPRGSLGDVLSWLVAGLGIMAIAYGIVASRRRRQRYGFPLRAVWADVTLGAIGTLVVAGAVWVANSYPWPPALAAAYAAEHGIPVPSGGLLIPTGIAIPVLLAIAIAVFMTFLAGRRRFGRYVYSIGGNPEAAELAGINTRLTIMKTFVAMGILAAIAAAVTSARLNAATNGLGSGVELQVIAAAVIGGTSFAGGIGTIAGGVLGAVIMQSLQSGMVLIGVDTALQDIVVGVVLVSAVGIDTILRRRATRG
ncbi:MAG TPA: sugar ABC transporter permease [Candidatus Eisenbacteria bacterium]|nr:sugar ABC transporter permease [Candidatus Eisenbacteria bacterium]